MPRAAGMPQISLADTVALAIKEKKKNEDVVP
jgi:hypothetical protein